VFAIAESFTVVLISERVFVNKKLWAVIHNSGVWSVMVVMFLNIVDSIFKGEWVKNSNSQFEDSEENNYCG